MNAPSRSQWPGNKVPNFGPFLEGASRWHELGIPVFPGAEAIAKGGIPESWSATSPTRRQDKTT
jgi:hypothetical protein